MLRRELFGRGLRYRVDYPVPGISRRKIDIAFPAARVATFVDGCFWHGCEVHFVPPKRNADWWRRKIEQNIARDRETDARLRQIDWEVLRFWEHRPAIECANDVTDTLAFRSR